MKAPKKVISLLISAVLVGSMSVNVSNGQVKNTTSESLVGFGRYETAIKISSNGWSSASEVVIVNDSALADALSATPFAKAKNAPILLTGSKSLDNRTKSELKRLGVKKVYLIGGKSVLSDEVENQLKSEGISIDRISGIDRYSTSLELAKRLDSNKRISKIAVVNGAKGLADAVSVGAPAAQNNIPIILADPVQGTQVSDSFIKSKSIKTSYIIGGESVVSNNTSSKLPNSKRLAGSTRNETNIKVIEEFYPKSDINSVYIAKDGGKGENQLIDALSVGVLAAKKESPVMIVSNGLTQTQKNLINSKNLNKVVQVGGQGNEVAFEAVKSQQKKNTYIVKDIDDLNSTISKADANDVVTIDTRDDVDENITIKTNCAISVILKGDYTKKVTINMPNGDITNEGDIDEVIIENLRYGTFTNEGDIDTLRVEDTQGGKIINDDDGNIETLKVSSNTKNVWIENDGDIVTLDNDSDTTVLDNDGDIDDDDAGEEDCLDPSDVDKGDYDGSSSGGSSSNDDDDDDDDEYDDIDIYDITIIDKDTIEVELDEWISRLNFKVSPSLGKINTEYDSSEDTYTLDFEKKMQEGERYTVRASRGGYKSDSMTFKYKSEDDAEKELISKLENVKSGETVVVYKTMTVSSNLIIPSGVTLKIDTGRSFTSSGTITNNGTIINDGTITNKGTITNGGTITNKGTLESSGTIINNGSIVGNVNIKSSGVLTKYLNVNGIITVDAGGKLSLADNGASSYLVGEIGSKANIRLTSGNIKITADGSKILKYNLSGNASIYQQNEKSLEICEGELFTVTSGVLSVTDQLGTDLDNIQPTLSIHETGAKLEVLSGATLRLEKGALVLLGSGKNSIDLKPGYILDNKAGIYNEDNVEGIVGFVDKENNKIDIPVINIAK